MSDPKTCEGCGYRIRPEEPCTLVCKGMVMSKDNQPEERDEYHVDAYHKGCLTISRVKAKYLRSEKKGGKSSGSGYTIRCQEG